jgi:hypothetical protein
MARQVILFDTGMVISVSMSRSDRKHILLTLLAANIVTSILHYVDNVVFFRHYPEPTWLSPHLVDLAWFVMTPFGVAGYLLFRRGRRSAALTCLYLYAAMGLLVLGHYLIAPPWEVSLKINLFIMAEAIAALLLGVFTAWLHFQGEGTRASA